MKSLNALLLTAAAAALINGAVSAEIVNLAYQGKEKGQSVKLDSALYSGNVFAGQLVHTITGGSTYDGPWITFCTDLSQHVSGSSKPFEVVSVEQIPGGSPMGVEKANALRDLYAYAAGAQLLPTASNALAAAFQLAIWEVIVDFDSSLADQGLSMTNGGLKASATNGDALSGDIASHLTSLFASIGSVDASGVQLVGFTSGQHQDQLIVVPAPGAFGMLAAAGLCFTRRRRA